MDTLIIFNICHAFFIITKIFIMRAIIMVATTEKVDLLKKELDVKMQDVEIEKEKTNILIEEVGRESNIAEAEEAAAK